MTATKHPAPPSSHRPAPKPLTFMESVEARLRRTTMNQALIAVLVIANALAIIPQLWMNLSGWTFDPLLTHTTQEILLFSTTSHITTLLIADATMVLMIAFSAKMGNYDDIIQNTLKHFTDWEVKLKGMGITYEFFSPAIDEALKHVQKLTPEDRAAAQAAMVLGVSEGMRALFEFIDKTVKGQAGNKPVPPPPSRKEAGK